MHRFILGVIAVLVAATALGRPLQAAEPPLEVNVILSLTGQGAFIGKSMQDMLNAFEATANKRGGIDGRQLHFVYLDDQTAPQVAVQLAN